MLCGKYKLILLTLGILVTSLANSAVMPFYINDTLESTSAWTFDDDVKVILIDPGHGGKDSGCSGHSLLEKDIALELAFKVGTLMKERFPRIEVRYTREDDSFIPLHQRVSMANAKDVDLFISLHCNALKDPSAHGIETYVMGLETNEENLSIAKRENDVILLEDLSTHDPYSNEGHIMMAMRQQQMMEKSISLAAFMQNSFTATRFRNRGVKQAGFVVLRKVLVPSVLVEAGFLTNPEDASFLKEEKEQNKIAQSIVSGVGKYIAHYRPQ